VTGVDSSLPALEIADKNALLNQSEIEWIEANAFDLLKDYSSPDTQYDTIVLDRRLRQDEENLETARALQGAQPPALKMLRPAGRWSPAPAPTRE